MVSCAACGDSTPVPRNRHVYAVRPFIGRPERTISRDDLLPVRAPLNIIQDVPAPDVPTPPEPHYPDQGEFWLGRPVSVGTATKPTPAPAVQQPVATAPIPSAASVLVAMQD